MSDPITVVAVDDHPLFLAGITTALTNIDDIDLVGIATTGSDAVAITAELKPRVVLMDLQLPDIDGIETTRRIVIDQPDTAVVVVTMFDDDDSVFAALRAGAKGYVLKGAHQDQVLRAIRAAAAGEAILGAPIAGRLIDYFDDRAPARAAFPQLSPRELEILEQIASGANNTEIARTLGLANKTIRNASATIFAKLRVADRNEAIIRARDAGLGQRPSR
jgi:DNA-binding NarL/FixJ family response regulator